VKNFIRKLLFSSVCLTLAISTGACQSNSNENLFSKKNIGTLIGAGAGAALGSNIGKGKGNVVAIAGGTLLGAALGREVGASLDRADMAYYNRASQHALENAKTGTATSWNNPDSGNYGTITPTHTYQAASGNYCRQYTQEIVIDGQPTTGYGKACRQPDGTWKISQ